MDPVNAVLFGFSTILLASIILLNSKPSNKGGRLFNYLLISTLFLIILDFFGRFDGLDQPYYLYFNHIGNFFLFLGNFLITTIWFMYVYYQLFEDEDVVKKFKWHAIIIFVVNAIFVIGSPFFHWIYYIDEFNIYHRGNLFVYFEVAKFLMVFASLVMLFIYRKRLKPLQYYSFLLFGIIPTAALIFQAFNYGVSATLNSIAVTLVIIYLNVQNKHVNSDYLTGVYNRRQLDYYITGQIRKSTVNNSFSAMLIDINDFKSINDDFGHVLGDEALKSAVDIIKHAIRKKDFIARFGGDEFCVVTDIDKENILEELVDRIKQSFNEFNQKSKTYKLNVAIGAMVYNVKKNLDLISYLDIIDQKMYKDKNQQLSQIENKK